MEERNFYEHLEEIRKIVIKSLIVIFIFSVLAYLFKEKLLFALTKPLEKELIYISPTEPFSSLIKLSLIVGFVISFPYVLYQIWRFVAEIFETDRRKKFLKYLFFSLLLFYGAILFCYFLVLPIVLNFFINFENSLINSITVSNYLNFSISLLLSFGIVFQFPLILLALINLQIVPVDYLRKNRAYFIIIILIVASILTPPDGISLLLLALPIIILFELTLIIARINIRK